MFKSKIGLFLLPLVLVIGIIIGTKFQSIFEDEKINQSSEKFNEILNLTKSYYYKDLNTDEMFEDAIEGMFEKLDPHSVYIPKQQQIGIQEQFNGVFEGIGIEFQIINDTITVVSPISGGPSKSVGIEAGDRIVKIDGENSVGFTNAEVVSNLRGEKGSRVNVTIFRPTVDEFIEFSIIRDEVPIYTVDASFIMQDSIGYIALSKFAETSTYEIKETLAGLTKIGMKKLVLDLRNNPGGYLQQAFQIADLFIDSTKMIVYTRGRRSELDDNLKAKKDYPYEKIPLSILINRGSASASEIVSGAIQDWDRGVLVGETSFGKGLVQKPFILPDSSAIRITIAQYFTPSGRLIQRHFDNPDDYYVEVYERQEEDADNINHEEEVDSTKTIYKTNAGRTVVDGGGITPDFIVKDIQLPSFIIKLRSRNLFYLFIRSYLDSHSEEIKKIYGNNLKKFVNEFEISSFVISQFKNYISEQNIDVSKKSFQKDLEIVKTYLKANIARNYWDNNGYYMVLLEIDKQYQKAEELLIKNFDLLESLN